MKARVDLGDPEGLVLPRKFYDRPTLEVARSLIGCYLHRTLPTGFEVPGLDGAGESFECDSSYLLTEPIDLVGRITEVEAYLGSNDDAAHSARGLTQRNRAMFGPPGHAYIYFIYGMYWCMNAVAGPVGTGEGVLIRGIEPVKGIDVMRRLRGGARAIADGPGKLTQALAITGEDYGMDLTVSDSPHGTIYITERTQPVTVSTTPRIGIDHATTKDEPWRFIDSELRRR